MLQSRLQSDAGAVVEKSKSDAGSVLMISPRMGAMREGRVVHASVSSCLPRCLLLLPCRPAHVSHICLPRSHGPAPRRNCAFRGRLGRETEEAQVEVRQCQWAEPVGLALLMSPSCPDITEKGFEAEAIQIATHIGALYSSS